jgi:hypothetical protein
MGNNMIEKIKQVNELCRKDGVYVDQNGLTTVSLWSKIKYFRQVFGDTLGIDTSIFEHDEYYIAKTKIVAYDPERVLATGHYKQFKKKNGSYLKGALPMAESFSISRALSFLGIMDTSITSKEEYESLDLPLSKGTKDTHQMMSVPIDKIVDEIKKAPHITRLKHLRNVKYAECFDLAIKKHPAVYKDLDNVYRIKLDNINRQEKI